MAFYTRIGDLTQIVGPLTEDSLLKCLKSRFKAKIYHTYIGADLLCINPFPLHDDQKANKVIKKLVEEVISQHEDSGQSQIIVISGETASGKSYYCQQIVNSICEYGERKCKNEVVKHLEAAMTVMHALGTASTIGNPDSSRMGYYIEAMTSDSVIYRSKIHCLFVDQKRISYVPKYESNFNIFYYMLSGLTTEEKVKLHLQDYHVDDLRYLFTGIGGSFYDSNPHHKEQFDVWKTSLASLDIPVMDVLRILSSVLLLGNIQFVDGELRELDTIGKKELKSVSALLGISGAAFYRGLTTTSHNANGQTCHKVLDAKQTNQSCDRLARGLYFRTVSAILKRINSIRRSNTGAHPSTESLESQGSSNYNSRPDLLSLSQGSHGHGRKFTDGFIGILDLFGFENFEVNNLERLCRNLCAEKIHNHYIKHRFVNPLEVLREECIRPDIDVMYTNNSSIIDLISSQPNGILPLLNRQCDLQKIKAEHTMNDHFFEPLPKSSEMFGVRHFAGRVNYVASDLLSVNQDQLPDDVISMFSKRSCNFGFASYIFSPELKQISSKGICGYKYRTMPSCHQDEVSEMDNEGLLSYDFNLRLDALLKSTSLAKSHYLHCLRSNDELKEEVFDSEVVHRQIHSIQLLEAVQLMSEGLPHRMKYRVFNSRYRVFMLYRLSHKPDNLPDETKELLECFLVRMDKSNQPYITTQWVYGRKHLFYSEGSRQCFDNMRQEILNKSATVLQSYWRGYSARRTWSIRKKSYLIQKQKNLMKATPIKTTFPSIPIPRYSSSCLFLEENLLRLSKIHNIPLLDPPPIPENRPYTIKDIHKYVFPQSRTFTEEYRDKTNCYFKAGEKVTVMGVSNNKSGCLIVQSSTNQYHVPFHLLQLDISS